MTEPDNNSTPAIPLTSQRLVTIDGRLTPSGQALRVDLVRAREQGVIFTVKASTGTTPPRNKGVRKPH